MDGDASAERRGDQIGVDRGSADPRVRSAKVMLMSIDWCKSKGLPVRMVHIPATNNKRHAVDTLITNPPLVS